MTRPWQRAEKRAARALRGRRVERARFESAPDIAEVPGWLPEVKYRKRLPRLVVNALRQAEAYAILGQKPVAVLFERGSRAGLAVLRLADFAEITRAGGAPIPPASPTFSPCRCAVSVAEGRTVITPSLAPAGTEQKEPT
ncbi:MAG: hypothetical protein KJ062_17025 [Thermoanaerobaculia bacterium]|nr:hypothetical protein [Thermoanaerobaculia bacterium]